MLWKVERENLADLTISSSRFIVLFIIEEFACVLDQLWDLLELGLIAQTSPVVRVGIR